MEARTILQKIRQRGFTIEPIGNDISLAPKKLLNERMINFIKKHKNDLLTALYQEQDEHKASHIEHKCSLPEGRLEVLRIMLHRFLADQKCRKMVNYRMDAEINTRAVEDYLDNELVNFDYDLEAIIAMYRIYTPKPKITLAQCAKCSYRPLFCLCKEVSKTETQG